MLLSRGKKSVLWKAAYAFYFKNPFSTLLALFGIIVGVTSTLSIDIILQSILRSDELSRVYAKGQANYRIIPEKGFIDEGLFARLKLNFPELPMAPVLEGEITVHKAKWKVFGIDLFSEMQIRSLLMKDLNSMTDSNWNLDLLKHHNAAIVLLKDEQAKISFTQMSQKEGSPFSSLKIIEIIPLGNNLLQNFYGQSLLMDLASAQEFMDRYGKLSHIDIVMENEAPASQKKIKQIEEFLSSQRQTNLKMADISKSAEDNERFSSAFRLNLRALSFLMFLVGIFLIANTIYLFSLKRYSLFSLYRCLGVSHSQIFWIFFTEILILAFLGSILGSMAGLFSAKALLSAVLQVFQDHYFQLKVANIAYDREILGRNFLLGVGGALLASIFPYWKISQLPPIQLMRKKSWVTGYSYLWKISVLGIILLTLGLGISFFSSGNLLLFLSFFFQILGYLCFVPLVVWGSLNILRLWKKLGIWWKLSTSMLINNLGHIFILMLALVMLFSTALTMEIFVTSFRNSFFTWLKSSLDADLFLHLEGDSSLSRFEKLKKRWMRDPKVTHLKTLGIQTVNTQAGELELRIAKTYKGENTSNLRIWKTKNKDNINQRMKNSNSVLISETLHHKKKWQEGDRIKVSTNNGFQEFEILGVYRDFSSEKGNLLISQELAQKFWPKPKNIRAALRLSKPEYSGLYRQKIEDHFSDENFLRVYSKDLLFETSLNIFDRTFQISEILKNLAFLVAFIGSLSAFLLLGNFQRVTFAYLRNIGCLRSEGFRVHLFQFLKIGCITGLVSLCLGFWMSWYLMQVINPQTFGWVIDWNFGWKLFLKFFGGLFSSIFLSSFISLFFLRDESLASLESE